MTEPTRLPALIPLDQLKEQAQSHLDHWTAQRDRAQGEVDKAQGYLDALGGKPARKRRSRRGAETPRRPSKELFDKALSFLAERGDRGATTAIIGRELGYSSTHINRVLQILEREGAVTREKGRHGKLHAKITEAGVERCTAPASAGEEAS